MWYKLKLVSTKQKQIGPNTKRQEQQNDMLRKAIFYVLSTIT